MRILRRRYLPRERGGGGRRSTGHTTRETAGCGARARPRARRRPRRELRRTRARDRRFRIRERFVDRYHRIRARGRADGVRGRAGERYRRGVGGSRVRDEPFRDRTVENGVGVREKRVGWWIRECFERWRARRGGRGESSHGRAEKSDAARGTGGGVRRGDVGELGDAERSGERSRGRSRRVPCAFIILPARGDAVDGKRRGVVRQRVERRRRVLGHRSRAGTPRAIWVFHRSVGDEEEHANIHPE